MARYNYRISNQTAGGAITGTISISAGATAVVGVTTSFQDDLHVDDLITSGAQTLVVASIADQTHLTVETAAAVAWAGVSFSAKTMALIESAGGYQSPRSTFAPWVDTVNLGNATARAMGRPSATWTWGIISLAQRNALRSYCTGKSARVYIRTRMNDDSDDFATYDAVMLWPDEETKQAGRRFPFTIQFRDLILL